MPSPAANGGNDNDLAKGIQRVRNLPEPQLDALWNSIVLDPEIKERLLAQAVLNFTLRPKVARTVLPLHGIILMVGPPGTGKTSLARGLANNVAKAFTGAKNFRLLEVEPHALTSSAHGKTQRAVSELFSQSICEAAMSGPTIVLLDEVETLAADRSKLSMEANPVDVHRATDAVLVQLDQLAEQFTNLLFVATSNFPQAVDSAFTSRCDLVLEVPLPDAEACLKILRDCLEGLAIYPDITLLKDDPGLPACAKECVGLDGRAIRKMVANALASDRKIAMDPNRLTLAYLVSAAKRAKKLRTGLEKLA